MFKKLLSTIGIGSAKVETILKTPNVEIGGILEGEVHIKGGKVRQEIDGIEVKLVVTYYREEEVSETRYISKTLKRLDVKGYFEINANEERTIPFKIDIPYDFPITYNECRIDVLTKVDVEDAPDPKDLDPVFLFDKDVDMIIHYLKNNGYTPKAECGECGKEHQEFHFENEERNITFQIEKAKDYLKINEMILDRGEMKEDVIKKALKLT